MECLNERLSTHSSVGFWPFLIPSSVVLQKWRSMAGSDLRVYKVAIPLQSSCPKTLKSSAELPMPPRWECFCLSVDRCEKGVVCSFPIQCVWTGITNVASVATITNIENPVNRVEAASSLGSQVGEVPHGVPPVGGVADTSSFVR